ncbi:MAG: TIGR01244 family sulfur transferase [Kangiellaceae bacterium]
MNLINIEDNFSISDQIKLEDIKLLAKNGVTTIICNRPDGEEPNQLTCAEIMKESEAQGINFVHIPSPGRDIPTDSLDLFIKTYQNNKNKIHAYCRTGTRSSIFWGLAKAVNLPTQDVLNKAKNVGIDLTAVIEQLQSVNGKQR